MTSPVTTADETEWIRLATEIRARSHSPYSHYAVGAVVVADGQVFAGANIENASYGVALCAERVAGAHAIMAGAKNFEAVVVVTQSDPPASPCGICRQALAEFSRDLSATRIITLSTQGTRKDFTLAELLPHSFRADALE